MNQNNILTSIRKIVRAINLESKRIEKEYGISIPQLLCLRFLYEQKDHRSNHKAVKKFLQLNASTTTGIIGRLEKKALLAKTRDTEDKRRTYVVLTIKGAEMVENTPEPLHRQFSRRLETLGDLETKEIERAFDIVVNFLNGEDLDASPILTGEAKIPGK